LIYVKVANAWIRHRKWCHFRDMGVGFTCAYLATPYAKRLTGSTVYVDGGASIVAQGDGALVRAHMRRGQGVDEPGLRALRGRNRVI
jgi:hypothetical protein